MKKYTSIKTKTTIYTVTLVVVGFIIICLIMFITLFSSQQNTVRAEFREIIRKHAWNFERRIYNAIDYLSVISNIVEFQVIEGVTDREALQNFIPGIFSQYPDINSSSLYFEPNMYDGKDTQYVGTEYGTALSGRISYYYRHNNGETIILPESIENELEFSYPFYIASRELNAPLYTEPAIYNIEGKDTLMFIIIYPIHSRNGEFIGAVTADIYLGDIYEQLEQEKIFNTGYIIIATDKEKIVYSPRYEDVGRTREEVGIIHALPEDTEGILIFNSRSILNDKKTLKAINTIFIPELNSRFFVSISAPVDEINAHGTRIALIILFLSIITIIFVTLLLYYLIGRMTKPLKTFTEIARNFGQGNFYTRIPGEYNDEYGILKDTVNLMAEQIEAQIKESKLNLRVLQTILNGIDSFIYVTVPQTGEVLFINEKMKKMFNMKGNEGIGEYCYKIFRKDQDKMCDFCPCIELDKNPDKVIVWEERVPELNRDIRHIDCYIDWPGDLKVHMQQAIDITDIKTITEEKFKAEREAQDLAEKKAHAEETSRMKSVFLASMSHEIRTPMHGIIGFSDLALDDNLPQKAKNYLTKIKASAESLLIILNDILDVSKIEAGKIELENIPFNIGEVIKLCRIIATPNASEKGLTLFFYAEPSVGKLLLGDPTRLRQVLLNLLSNAVKFTNNGMVKLLAAIVDSKPDSITMHFEVKDSGIGMTEDQIKKIFQPFIQGDDSTTRKYGGTGLGLTITKSFIELMGGDLKVESNPGVGSRFSFNLTFKTIDADVSQSNLDISVNCNEKPFFNGEVLICEDNDLNKMVISDHLNKVGLKTVIAENGKVGVELIKNRMKNAEKPFDLIFMDIHMPVMDGLEAAKNIIKIGSRVPIIALTANVMTNDKEAYFASGMVDCLPKPFVVQELWTILLKYITPVSMMTINRNADTNEEEDHRMEIMAAFVKGNRDTFKNISDALEAGDIILAHRLVHTLKGVAGLIGMTTLAEAAKVLEQTISLGKTEQLDDEMNALETELKTALEKLAQLTDKYTNNITKKTANALSLSRDDAIKFLEKLDNLLESDNYDSLDMAKELSSIPGSQELAEQIENLEFKKARETLAAIKSQIAAGWQ